MALSFRKFVKGIFVQNETDRTKELGLTVDNSASSGTSTTLVGKQTLNRTLDLPNTSGVLVEKDFAQTLTNKTIDGDDNTLQDISLSSLKTVLADANEFIARDVSGQVVSVNTVPAGTVVGTSDTQTLTNKTISGSSNTITNVSASNVVTTPSGNFTATDVQAGFIELQGDIDTINTNAVVGPASATDNAIVRFDGTTGKLVQNSGVIISDTNNITGVVDLTTTGNVIVGGDLTVNGTTTTINTATLDVEDKNITVNYNGTDITAEGAGLTVDRTGTSGSLVYEDSLASKWKAGALGSEIELANVSSSQSLTNKNLKSNTNLLTGAKSDSFVRETGNGQTLTIPDASSPDTLVAQAMSQTLTNKDYDGGTASNTSRLTIPKNTYSNLLGLTRKEGTIVYASDLDTLYADDGTNLVQVGSAAGAVNFISNGAAEASTTGWALYQDPAASAPTDGTGGTPTGLTFTRSTSSPLAGQGSFIFDKNATNQQGAGVSYDFSIDTAYRAKVLNITFDYSVNSGTFVAGSSTTNSDMVVYIYDVTNSQLIQPSSINLFSNSSTIPDQFNASFQTSATGSQYRLIFHCASTSASAYSLKIDNVSVNPSNYIYGSPITDWQTYTPTGSWSTNSTYIGRWRRVGSNMEIQARVTLTGAPNNTSLTFNLPAGYSIDTSNNEISNRVGYGYINDLGVTNYTAGVLVETSTSLKIVAYNASTTYARNDNLSTTVPFTFGNGDSVDFTASVVIVGWSSSVQMSDSTDTRVCVATLSGSTTSITSSATVITPSTVLVDTHGAFSGSTYTVPVSGLYEITMQFRLNSASYTNGNAISAIVRHNSTDYQVGFNRVQVTQSASFGANGSFIINAVSGDTIRFVGSSDQTAAIAGSSAFLGSIQRITGPSAIAATETVACKYYNSSGTSIANSSSQQMVYPTRVIDTHNAFNGATGVFTAPISGIYSVSANITLIVPSGVQLDLVLFVGESRSDRAGYLTGTSTTHGRVASSIVRLSAGQTITASIFQTSGASRNLEATTDGNTISIYRIGS